MDEGIEMAVLGIMAAQYPLINPPPWALTVKRRNKL
jgi:hypothetical protein